MHLPSTCERKRVIGFPEPLLRHTLKVPFTYLSIHFTVVQCSFPRLLIYWLKVPTTKAMLGLVQTITYISLPTIDTYGTIFLSTFPFSPYKHCLKFSLQFLDKAFQLLSHILSYDCTKIILVLHNYVHPQNGTLKMICIKLSWNSNLLSFLSTI